MIGVDVAGTEMSLDRTGSTALRAGREEEVRAVHSSLVPWPHFAGVTALLVSAEEGAACYDHPVGVVGDHLLV